MKFMIFAKIDISELFFVTNNLVSEGLSEEAQCGNARGGSQRCARQDGVQFFLLRLFSQALQASSHMRPYMPQSQPLGVLEGVCLGRGLFTKSFHGEVTCLKKHPSHPRHALFRLLQMRVTMQRMFTLETTRTTTFSDDLFCKQTRLNTLQIPLVRVKTMKTTVSTR